jgi:hypothetical protein
MKVIVKIFKMDSKNQQVSSSQIKSQALGGGGPGGNAPVELDHAIGYSGRVLDSALLHPNTRDYVLIAGSSIVVGDLSDPHN